MATNGGSTRDAAARRRRIAERGSERLALITGRAQSISSSPLPPSVAQSHDSSTAPSPPSIPRNSDQPHISDDNTNSHLNKEIAADDFGSNIQTVIPDSKTITETVAQTFFEPSNTQSFPTSSTKKSPPISTSLSKSQSSKSQSYFWETLTPNRLRPAFKASEDMRRNISFVVAVLVVLSYAGFPILGSNIIKNLLLIRPLVLLVLTNITIVVAPLLLEKVNHKEQGLTNPLSKALEWGLLIKTGFSALFMDCSIYSVVVVCGISFLQMPWW